MGTLAVAATQSTSLWIVASFPGQIHVVISYYFFNLFSVALNQIHENQDG